MLASIVKIKPAGRGPTSPIEVRKRGSAKMKDSSASLIAVARKRSREEKILHLVSLHISIEVAGLCIYYENVITAKTVF